MMDAISRNNLSVVARRSEPHDSLDYFPTPPWATRAFVDHVLLKELGASPNDMIWEPACGEGHMAAALAETFPKLFPSDVFDYGYGAVIDFLREDLYPAGDWLVTNPPFNLALEFAAKGLNRAAKGVCLLLRTQWLHGLERHDFFTRNPPALIALYAERVPMHRGRWEPKGSTATDYCWVCWRLNVAPRITQTRIVWIPPGQRKALTMPRDAERFGAKVVLPMDGVL